AYLCGTPLPDQPWLCGPFFGIGWAEQNGWSGFMDPEFEQNAWKLPIVEGALNDRQKLRLLQLIVENLRFDLVNSRLPQVLCHNDVHRKNFMWAHSPQTNQKELIGVDWAFTGPGAAGNDLGGLVGNSLYFFDYDPYDVETLEAVLLEGYLAGIADHRVEIDPRLVRLGYLISLSFFMEYLPGWTPFSLPPDSKDHVQDMYGHSAKEVLASWVYLNAFCLDRADEARSLIKQLDL
ncbi:MAG: phosphotransferase, partial [Anaerolineae bacterium]|nr:phosphotransferase [Anaerolineae bacterium]